MAYTRPAYNAANATWQGASAYTRPPHNAANATWAQQIVEARAAAPSPLGVPAVVADIIIGAILTYAAAPSPLSAPSILARRVGVARASAPSPLMPPAIAGTVVRYELRGEVRIQGVLVDRRVRAYRRGDGALVAEQDTTAGAFRIHAGFAASEHYLVPVDMSAEATDFAPPCANRVLSVLADDLA